MRNNIIKVDGWFEETVPEMIPREFRRFFRMYDQTLNAVVQLVHESDHLTKYRATTIPVHKKVAMCCTYLGTITPTMQ